MAAIFYWQDSWSKGILYKDSQQNTFLSYTFSTLASPESCLCPDPGVFILWETIHVFLKLFILISLATDAPSAPTSKVRKEVEMYCKWSDDMLVGKFNLEVFKKMHGKKKWMIFFTSESDLARLWSLQGQRGEEGGRTGKYHWFI